LDEIGTNVLILRRLIVLEKELRKYLGSIVEIIYIDKDQQITQRLIELRSVKSGSIKAYCLQRKALRIFKIESILAIQLVIGRETA
jgi:predicted DNA-binding transcriptional regulator YafY